MAYEPAASTIKIWALTFTDGDEAAAREMLIADHARNQAFLNSPEGLREAAAERALESRVS